MMPTARLKLALHAGCMAALILPASPSWADDATTGIVAGLGLSAANGKTTLDSGAGVIEAGLLNAAAFHQTGEIIASIVNHVAGGTSVLVVARDEAINLMMPDVVKDRIASVQKRVGRSLAQCKPAAKHAETGPVRADALKEVSKLFGNSSLMGSDIVAAVATETTISPIALTAEDRLLIDSVLLNSTATGYQPNTPLSQDVSPAATSITSAHYIVPSEATQAGRDGVIRNDYNDVQSKADDLRATGCVDTETKAVLSEVDALVTSVNAPDDKTGVTPLATAIQLEALGKSEPLILRLAIEQIGGTSITRTGVLYTLGLPNAAVVSSGLLVSFRLVNPRTGTINAVGLVRCATAPVNIKQVRQIILVQKAAINCAYQASGGSQKPSAG